MSPEAHARKRAKAAQKRAQAEQARQALLATPVDRAKPRAEMRSKSRAYPVGERGEYVYHLVAGRPDRAERDALVHKYDLDFNLCDAERADLAARLEKLDQERARPQPQPPRPSPRRRGAATPPRRNRSRAWIGSAWSPRRG